MASGSPSKRRVLREVKGELSARSALLRRQEQEVRNLRLRKEREIQRLVGIDASRQKSLYHDTALQEAASPARSAFGHSYATPEAAVAASVGSPVRPSAGAASHSPRPAVDPLERSHAAVELAQAVTAQRRTQLAAKAAVDAKQRATLDRYREIKEAGEARVAVAQRDLERAQSELRQTTSALDNAQTVLAERSQRLNEARGKLATLMSMTRDLLRLVKPVTDMRAAARRAAATAGSRLSSLGHRDDDGLDDDADDDAMVRRLPVPSSGARGSHTSSPKRVGWAAATGGSAATGGYASPRTPSAAAVPHQDSPTPASAQVSASISDVEARFKALSTRLGV